MVHPAESLTLVSEELCGHVGGSVQGIALHGVGVFLRGLHKDAVEVVGENGALLGLRVRDEIGVTARGQHWRVGVHQTAGFGEHSL
jgi:hypothetical protein